MVTGHRAGLWMRQAREEGPSSAKDLCTYICSQIGQEITGKVLGQKEGKGRFNRDKS